MKKSMWSPWWRPAIALLLLTIIAGFDQLISRGSGIDGISPLADFVDKVTAAQREKKQLRQDVANGELSSANRLRAAQNLLKLYSDDKNPGRSSEGREVARAIVDQLLAVADISSLIAPCEKLLVAPPDRLWLLEQWQRNVMAVVPPGDQPARLLTIASKAAAAQNLDHAVTLINTAFSQWARLSMPAKTNLLKQLTDLLTADSKTAADSAPLAVLLRREVSANWQSWWGNPVEPIVLNNIAGWHRQAHAGTDSVAAQWALALLNQVSTAAGEPPPLAFLSAQYQARLLYAQDDEQALLALEDPLIALLEKQTAVARPAAADLGLLQQIYRRRNDRAKVAALQQRLDTHGEMQKMAAAAIQRLRPVVAQLRDQKWESAQTLYQSKIAAEMPTHLQNLPPVQVIDTIMTLLAMTINKKIPVALASPLPGIDQCKLLDLPPGIMAMLYLYAYAVARDNQRLDMALSLLDAAQALYDQQNPHLSGWIEKERWFLLTPDAPAPVPVHLVPYRPGATPKFDGYLDEAVYSEVAPIETFMLSFDNKIARDPAPAELATKVWLWHDNQWLYLAVEAAEPDMANASIVHSERDSDIWLDDSFEFYINGTRCLRQFEQWCFNAIGGITALQLYVKFNNNNLDGVCFTSHHINLSTTRSEIGGRRAAAAWYIETRIALSEISGIKLPVHGTIVPANVRRMRYGRSYQMCFHTWSPNDGVFHSLQNFQLLRFE